MSIDRAALHADIFNYATLTLRHATEVL